MSDFSDKIRRWNEDNGGRQPTKPKPPPEPGFELPLPDKLDEMALLLMYGYWNTDEHYEETKLLLQRAAKVIRVYEDIIQKGN